MDAGVAVYRDGAHTPAGNGDTVQHWHDQGTTHLDLTQNDAPQRPIFRTNQLNGHPALDFDGVDDDIWGGTMPGTTAHGDWFVVCRPDTTTAGQTVVGQQNLMLVVSDNIGTASTGWYDGTWRSFALPLLAPQMLNYTFDGNNLIARLTRNLVRYPWTTYTPFDPTQTTNVGSRYGGGQYHFNGLIAEVAYYSRILSFQERAAVQSFLQTKYALW